MSSLFYDRDGRRLTVDAWCDLLAKAEYRRVGLTAVGGLKVSTVWIGLERGEGRTMIFGDDDDDDLRELYATLAEAEAGHARIVAMLQARLELSRK